MGNELQNTEKWHSDRIGKITSSRLSDITAVKGFGKVAYSYLDEILSEYFTGKPTQIKINDDIQRGIYGEPIAIERYEYETLNLVEPVGFVKYSDAFGGSPDGLVGKDGIIEVKCPNAKNHMSFIRTNEILQKYYYQIQGNLIATGRDWCDFISYNADFNRDKQMKIKRVFRDEDTINKIIERIEQFYKLIEKWK